MHTDRIARERALLATILKNNPAFGTKGDLLAKVHTPTHPGPGGQQRPCWNCGGLGVRCCEFARDK